jgi:hypothetical protein
MVAQDRKRQAVDGENRSQQFQPISNPLAAILKRFAANRIVTTKKSPSHAAAGQMQNLNCFWIEIFATRKSGHGRTPALTGKEVNTPVLEPKSLS